MRYSELIKLITQNGCRVYREGTRHTMYINPKTNKKFPVSRHKTEEVVNKTLKSIKRDAGLD